MQRAPLIPTVMRFRVTAYVPTSPFLVTVAMHPDIPQILITSFVEALLQISTGVEANAEDPNRHIVKIEINVFTCAPNSKLR